MGFACVGLLLALDAAGIYIYEFPSLKLADETVYEYSNSNLFLLSQRLEHFYGRKSRSLPELMLTEDLAPSYFFLNVCI